MYTTGTARCRRQQSPEGAGLPVDDRKALYGEDIMKRPQTPPHRVLSRTERIRLARRTAGAWKDFPETGAEYVERIRGARRLQRMTERQRPSRESE